MMSFVRSSVRLPSAFVMQRAIKHKACTVNAPLHRRASPIVSEFAVNCRVASESWYHNARLGDDEERKR